MKNYLLISLGHNSSAAFVKPDGSIIAYEQERFDGIKSSSAFPLDAINKIVHTVGANEVINCAIRISHWFNFHDSFNEKYISLLDIAYLKSLSSDLEYVNSNFTHHDAHAYSAYLFFRYHETGFFESDTMSDTMHTFVIDGFGNNEEVISVYKSNGLEKPVLIHRKYGYEFSLGLMYQYATGFCGMKENQDEYKFLGYEAEIDKIATAAEIKATRAIIEEKAKRMFDAIMLPNLNTFTGNIAEELFGVREMWNRDFSVLLELYNIKQRSSHNARCIIAFFIQGVLETVVKHMCDAFKVINLTVAGGVFYNVKLNNAILDKINGAFCIMPLAGDQGAALGFIARETNYILDFSTLVVGKRDLRMIDKLVETTLTGRNKSLGVRIINKDTKYEDAVKSVASHIMLGKIVNLVTDTMEFGPRALCATSSIFLPTKELVAYNNKLNNRNEIMPCAPIMKQDKAHNYFYRHDLDRVIGSNEFMICALDYKDSIPCNFREIGGVMHKKTLQSVYTGRPQLLNSGFMYDVLTELEQYGIHVLVNTSFNAHGNPIVYTPKQIVDNYKYQLSNSEGNNIPYLIVIK